MLTLTNRIDMRPGAVPLVIHLGQYDSDFSLVFELYSSAGNFTVESGTTAMIRGTKTDGNAYDADATIDISAKTVTVAGSEQMTAAKGRNVYELVLTKSGKVLSTANFILDVERAAMDADTIASESVLKELNAIIAGAETATEAAQTATAAADSVSSASAQIATNTADIADLKADLSESVGDLKSALKRNLFFSLLNNNSIYDVILGGYLNSLSFDSYKGICNIIYDSTNQNRKINIYNVDSTGEYTSSSAVETFAIPFSAGNTGIKKIELANHDYLWIDLAKLSEIVASVGFKSIINAKAKAEDYSVYKIEEQFYDISGEITEIETNVQKNTDDIDAILPHFEIVDSLGKTTNADSLNYSVATCFRGYATRISNPGQFNRISVIVQTKENCTVDAQIRKDNFDVIATAKKIISLTSGFNDYVSFDFDDIISDESNLYFSIETGSNANVLGVGMATGYNAATALVTADNTGTTNGNYVKDNTGFAMIKNAGNAKSFSMTFDVQKVSIDSGNGNNGKTVRYNYRYVATTGNDITGDGSNSKPFATIYHANEVINNNNEYNRYIIIVKKGTYTDLQTRYSGISSGGGSYQGIICKDYVYYQSEDLSYPAQTVISWDGATGLESPVKADIIDKAPFHIESHTHTWIKGFKFVCKNMRYCLHVESARRSGIDALIEGCILDWQGRPDISDDNHDVPAIGIGLAPLNRLTICRCNIANSESDFGFQHHDNSLQLTNEAYPPVLDGAFINIKGCNFNNTKIQFRNIYNRQTTQRLAETHEIALLENNVGVKRLWCGNYEGDDLPRWVRFDLRANEITTNDVTNYLV